jgi:hypothetical protein
MSRCVGASLLQDAGVGGEQVVPAMLASSHKTLSGGVIAAIVIVGVIVLLAIGVCIVCVLRRQREDVSTGGELKVTNALFDPNAASSPDETSPARANTVTGAPYSNTMGSMTMGDTMLRRPMSPTSAPVYVVCAI